MKAPLAVSLACLCCHAVAAPAAEPDTPAAHLIPTTTLTVKAPAGVRMAPPEAALPTRYAPAVPAASTPAAPRAATPEAPARSGTGTKGWSLAMALALMAGIALRRWRAGTP